MDLSEIDFFPISIRLPCLNKPSRVSDVNPTVDRMAGDTLAEIAVNILFGIG